MLPTEPAKNAIGMNTDTSTTVIPMMAPLICPMAFFGGPVRRQIFLSHQALDVSTTTMASSTRMPMASTMPNIVSTLIENPAAASVTPKGPSRATGTTRVGNQGVANVLQEQEHHQEHQNHGFGQVSTTWLIEILMKPELSYGKE